MRSPLRARLFVVLAITALLDAFVATAATAATASGSPQTPRAHWSSCFPNRAFLIR